MFFSTRSRSVDLFGFSFFSATETNPSCVVFDFHLRLRIAYLPYASSEALYQYGHFQIVAPTSRTTK
jgi:hypothetical protein